MVLIGRIELSNGSMK